MKAKYKVIVSAACLILIVAGVWMFPGSQGSQPPIQAKFIRYGPTGGAILSVSNCAEFPLFCNSWSVMFTMTNQMFDNFILGTGTETQVVAFATPSPAYFGKAIILSEAFPATISLRCAPNFTGLLRWRNSIFPRQWDVSVKMPPRQTETNSNIPPAQNAP